MADVVVATTAAAIATVVHGKALVWDPLSKALASSKNVGDVHGVLKDAIEKLRAKRNDHEIAVERCKMTKMTSNTYDAWNRGVKNIEDNVEILLKEYDKRKKKISHYLSSPFAPNSKLSDKMKQMAEQVINHLAEGNGLGEILIDKEPSTVVKMIAPDIKDFPTLHGALEKILGCLSETNVTGIRIHGQFGSGKTTIMRNLNNHDKVVEMFDIVIWVTVSNEGSKGNFGLHHLQHDIAKRLGFDAESVGDQVAVYISEKLKRRKYLLLLDDVKEDIDLDEIGIPAVGTNDSKVVFTTRLQAVCYSLANRQVDVLKLQTKEALRMFKTVLGRPDLEANAHINRQMFLVVKWCAYLPLTIKVVASAFRVNDTEAKWCHAKKKLAVWPDLRDDSMIEMFKLLNGGYDDYLVGSRKTFFFYSAMYPEDSQIQKDCLLNNWAADNDDVAEKNSSGNGRDILYHLTEVSLLEESKCQSYVTMHKIIRLLALYKMVTDTKRKYLVKSGEALQECPNLLEWAEKSWISLVDSTLNTLPDTPDSVNMLSTLFLQKNPNLKSIPPKFFEHMKNLCVLDLDHTGIAALPLSLTKLIKLKALYLNTCINLDELPDKIEDLQQLEVLDIRGSGFKQIPTPIEKLVRLRLLLASFIMLDQCETHNLVSNCEVISKISTLEELVIDVTTEIKSQEELDKLLKSAVITEIKPQEMLDKLLKSDVIAKIEPLAQLSTFQFCCQRYIIDVIKVVGDISRIYFPREDVLTKYVKKSFNLTSFQFFIGCQMSSLPQIPKFNHYFKYIRYCDGEVSYPAISQVLSHADAFELVDHNELEHLSEFTGSMNEVKGCLIESCRKIRIIVDVNHGSSILQNLERLYMKNLATLSSLWEGSLLLPRLMTLVLNNCPIMTQVCPYIVIQELPELQHLEVNNCCGIVELITESANIGPTVFPKLRKLILLDMPELKCILAKDSFKWPSLEKLKIQGCPRLLRLPFTKDGALKLKSLTTEKIWWEALENPDVKDHLHTFCTFN